MKKFFQASFALAVLATGIAASAPNVEAATFSDVRPADHFYKAVTTLSDCGIIKGYTDGTFKPYQNVTRGQAAKIIAGALGLDTENVKNPNFSDVPTTNEYYGAIAALANAGIISGYPDGTFKPDAPVKRYHIAKILSNAFNLQLPQYVGFKSFPFTDVDNSGYEEYVYRLYLYNITSGTTPTTFGGNDYVTRGQLAKFVLKCIQLNEVLTEVESDDTTTSTSTSTETGTTSTSSSNTPAYIITPDGKAIPNPAIDYEGYLRAMGIYDDDKSIEIKVDGQPKDPRPIIKY